MKLELTEEYLNNRAAYLISKKKHILNLSQQKESERDIKLEAEESDLLGVVAERLDPQSNKLWTTPEKDIAAWLKRYFNSAAAVDAQSRLTPEKHNKFFEIFDLKEKDFNDFVQNRKKDAIHSEVPKAKPGLKPRNTPKPKPKDFLSFFVDSCADLAKKSFQKLKGVFGKKDEDESPDLVADFINTGMKSADNWLESTKGDKKVGFFQKAIALVFKFALALFGQSRDKKKEADKQKANAADLDGKRIRHARKQGVSVKTITSFNNTLNKLKSFGDGNIPQYNTQFNAYVNFEDKQERKASLAGLVENMKSILTAYENQRDRERGAGAPGVAPDLSQKKMGVV